MTEPRRSTRARAREDAAPPAPETPSEKPAKGAKSTLKRKRTSIAVKDSTPSTPIGEVGTQTPKQTLPLRIVEGQPLPTLPEPQPLDLSSTEWQNIQQSGVLSASLQRSRAVWVSGVNFRTFHKKHTMPKKTSERTDADKAGRARQKEIEKNFPQVGTLDAQLVIEPHTFPIKLYAPKEGSRAVPKKMPPPPQQYGTWPNHNQHSQHPPQYQQYNQAPYPSKPQPQARPPPPKPVQQAPPQTQPGPASTPAPDPVIHMLAARAGTDPELKAVMKIVAAGQASKEQLEFFQTHINELTEILEKNKKAKAPIPLPPVPNPAPAKQQAPSPAPPKQQATAPAPPKQQPPAPAPAAPKQQAPAPAPAATPTPSPAPPKQQAPTPTPPHPRPTPPAQQQQQQQQPPPPTPTQKPFNPAPPLAQQQRPAPPQSRPPLPNTYPPKNYNQPPYYQQPPPHYAPSQPPRVTYRPLTFEFVEGNGDRFYFPSYSFMEWLPNGSGAKFSFLVTKLKPKPETASKLPSTPSTPAPPQTQTPAGAPNATSAGPIATNSPFPPTPGGPTATPQPHTPSFVAPPRIEDFDERNDMKDIEFYQPVTVLVLTDEHEVKNALPRSIRPPSVVEKYMEEVFNTCKRAEETYLAFRLPRDGITEIDTEVKSGNVTPSIPTPIADVVMGGMAASGTEKRKNTAGRPRKSIAV